MIWIRRLLIALAVLAALIVVVVGAVLLLVDPNDYKQVLEQEVMARYKRSLAIDGDIRLSFIPSLGLEISGVALSEPESNQMFAAMDSARVSLAWWPLLSRHLVIEHLTVNGLKANLVRDENGRFNFEDFIRRSPDAGDAPEDSDARTSGSRRPSLDLDIGGITVNGGEVALSDARSKTALRVERLSASAKGIAFDAPFEFAVSGRVLGQSPRADATVQASGRMRVDLESRLYAVQGLELRVAGMLPDIRANAFSVRGNAQYRTRTRELDMTGLAVTFQGDVALATPLTGVDASLSLPQASINLSDGAVALEKLSAKAQGKLNDAPFSAAIETPKLRVSEAQAEGGPIQLVFRSAGKSTWDGKAAISNLKGSMTELQAEEVAIDVKFTQGERRAGLVGGSPVLANLRAHSIQLPALNARLELTNSEQSEEGIALPVRGSIQADFLAQQAEINLDAGEEGARLSAHATVSDFDQPSVRFDVSADTLDVDRFLPVFTAVGKAPEKAPAAKEKPSEPSNGGQSLPSGPGLNGIRAEGTVRARHLQVRGLEAANVSATINVAEGKAAVADVQASLYGGSLTGGAVFEGVSQALSVDAELNEVAVQPLMVALGGVGTLSGTGDVSIDVHTVATNQETLRQQLDGTLAVRLRDGAYRGINIAQSLRQFRNLIGTGQNESQQADRTLSTDFTELRGRLELKQGVGVMRDLVVTAPLLRVTEGKPATINLIEETLDVVVLARVVNTSTGQGGKALEELRDIAIPIHISGSFHDPTYDIRWAQVSSDALKRALRNEAERQIDRLLRRDQNTDESSNPTGRILGDALKGLFN